MSTTFNELLGDELIQHNESDDQQLKTISTNQLQGKTIAIYFSAHWCPPCKKFTPKLAKLYQELNDEKKSKFEIVFVSSDEDEEAFKKYYQSMPWKALPYADRERKEKLSEKFELCGIPTLVVISPSGETILTDAVEEVRTYPEKAIESYIQGKKLFWTREPKDGEFVWENGKCNQCLMSPIVGSRYGSANQESSSDLCQTCFDKESSKDSFFEYLTPKKQYSLEQILSSVPHLLQPGKDEHIPVNSILSKDLKSIGLYFSAHWCGPCRSFTPTLAELYKEIRKDSNSFEVLFFSCDQDDESFNEYRSEMPWPATPLNSAKSVPGYFEISGIPALIILSSDGTILSRDGRGGVGRSGIEALKTWARGDKLARPPPDQFKWEHVSCDGCAMAPLIGQRYSCETCGNYDLCSECEKKGHDHPLKLVEQPDIED